MTDTCPIPVEIPTDQNKFLDGWRCSDGKEFCGQIGEAQAVQLERTLRKYEIVDVGPFGQVVAFLPSPESQAASDVANHAKCNKPKAPIEEISEAIANGRKGKRRK